MAAVQHAQRGNWRRCWQSFAACAFHFATGSRQALCTSHLVGARQHRCQWASWAVAGSAGMHSSKIKHSRVFVARQPWRLRCALCCGAVLATCTRMFDCIWTQRRRFVSTQGQAHDRMCVCCSCRCCYTGTRYTLSLSCLFGIYIRRCHQSARFLFVVTLQGSPPMSAVCRWCLCLRWLVCVYVAVSDFL